MEEAKFTYSPLGKALETQTKKQVDALKSSNLSNKIDEFKQIDSMFSQNQTNGLIFVRLKKIKQLQNNIILNKLDYKVKRGKIIILVNTHYLLSF